MSTGRERDIVRRNTHILNSRYAQKRVNHSNSMYALLEAIKSTQIRQSPSTKIWNWIVFFRWRSMEQLSNYCTVSTTIAHHTYSNRYLFFFIADIYLRSILRRGWIVNWISAFHYYLLLRFYLRVCRNHKWNVKLKVSNRTIGRCTTNILLNSYTNNRKIIAGNHQTITAQI